MESRTSRLRSAVGIAFTYLLVGVSWIIVTDYVVLELVGDPQTTARLQTAKGWLFVIGSTGLVYALVRSNQRRHERTTDRLEHALQQTSVLHRLLRHNLRNNCNVIRGNAELLEANDEVPADVDPYLAEIKHQTDRLVELGSKTRCLRDAVLDGDEPVRRLDLTAAIDAVVDDVRDGYPAVTIDTDRPETCYVRTTPKIERALRELLGNAIEHSERADPAVRIAVRRTGEGVDIVVDDDGPGLPATERTVLEEGIESPMIHSEGLGLWIVRTIVVQAGGSVKLVEKSSGTTIVLSLPD
ncbi:sensor histidine kinase [Haloterrigena salifodinae]|uniref:sensor histidine kinase n=1 Tax=Haloterrigena salifodinae TaxID=2675099 RepID=UPI000F89183E|nr:HAMP domain-containing sensor histidine kinase [Haloterrigena salifodinae]